MSASRIKIPAESQSCKEREYGEKYCEESWQRLKGRTIMSGDSLVEKLEEAVCFKLLPGRDFPQKRKL